MIPKTETHNRRNVSVQISLRGILWLIWDDTLRRVHNVVYFAGSLHVDRTLIRDPFVNKPGLG